MTGLRGAISVWLANRETRARVHAGILLAGAGLLLVGWLSWDTFDASGTPADKIRHYEAGRLITAGVFYIAYICIVVRILMVAAGRGSLTKLLLWIPSVLAGGGLAGIILALVFAAAKEGLDTLGFGSVEGLDLDATVEGALSMTSPIALIMAFTPFFIPLDILMQLPKLMLDDVRTGIRTFDTYITEQKSHGDLGQPVGVIVVEDDIVCATTVMNFCRNIGLRCHHVSTLGEADEYLSQNMKSIRLVVLDNFVRVDKDGSNRTGCEWLQEINTKVPANKRTFLVVIISGHTELLGEAASIADLVLKKPWEPRGLVEFLKKHGVVKY